MPCPKIFLSAGEASGEHYGALLIPALRRLLPDAEFFGLGGERMERLNFRRIVRAEDVAVMGITEVIRHMPHIYSEYRRLKRSIAAEKPDAAILIDFPDVNLGLARELRKQGVPVVYFVSPQLWAWKKYRIRHVRRYVDRMLVIFPFEEAFYLNHSVEASFVGHPLAELPLPAISRRAFADEYALNEAKQWIALLPGSRPKEIRLNLPEMISAARLLNEDSEWLLPLAPTLTPEQVNQVKAMVPGSPRITLIRDARAALHHARAGIVASGTATVEAALIGNPFLVVYRVSALTYAVAQRVVDLPHVAMVNLVAGSEIVPELIQSNFSAAKVVSTLRPLLHDEQVREKMQSDLKAVAAKLRGKGDAIETVAGITTQLIYDSRLSLVS